MPLKQLWPALYPSSGKLSLNSAWSARRPACLPCTSAQRRSFASIREDAGPPSWPTSKHPTPYEILGLEKGAPYDKRAKARYFQLAKLYHPDHHQHNSSDGLSRTAKLERYRLIVAANELLSDTQKRRMYDLYGIGWLNQPAAQSSTHGYDREWHKRPGNPSMNATWEDWEKWYQERDSEGEKKQEEIFMSNSGFFAIMGLCIIVGTWVQATRAGANGTKLLDMREEQHLAVTQELWRRQAAIAGLNREARVNNFLQHREFEKWAYDPPNHGLPDANTPLTPVLPPPPTGGRKRSSDHT